MYTTLRLSSSSLIITLLPFFFFFFLLLLPSTFCQDIDPRYTACTPTFQCGSFDSLSFPFWGNDIPNYCGYPGFRLDCQGTPNVTMDISSHTYNVLGIDSSAQVIKIVSQDFARGPCPNEFFNVTLDMDVLNCTSNVRNITLLYNCSSLGDFNTTGSFRFPCSVEYQTQDAYLFPTDIIVEGLLKPGRCRTKVLVPVLNTAVEELLTNVTNISGVLSDGFEVYWKIPDAELCKGCLASGGRCGYNSTSDQIICFCEDGESKVGCPASDQNSNNFNGPTVLGSAAGSEMNTKVKAAIGVGAAFGFAGLMSLVFLLYLRRYKKRNPSSTSMPQNPIDAPHQRSKNIDPEHHAETTFGIHVFTYTELEEATSYFADANELGEGGFGTVYYGKLKDGREVAVKRLFENSSKWLKQYMNEVSILTRIRHKNLVTLYGYTSRHSRELLLVYEYVSNGTVADHLHGCKQHLIKGTTPLPWPTRLSIAIETASALVYLHASDIIHRDVKTNNILLDSNFSVKVADFGMSRLFPLDVTHVSTAPQGTPGYVDPEYHQCYHLTDKSDVYSFGVVLVELITSLAPVDITRRRNEINLSNLALNKIQNHELHEIIDGSIGFETDRKVEKGVKSVAELAFRCLQSAREIRPGMEEVLDTLLIIKVEFERKEGEDKADVFNIPANDVVSMKGDLSAPFSPATQVSSELSSASG